MNRPVAARNTPPIAIHGNEESREKHEEMGFHDGWGTVLDQLVAYVKEELA